MSLSKSRGTRNVFFLFSHLHRSSRERKYEHGVVNCFRRVAPRPAPASSQLQGTNSRDRKDSGNLQQRHAGLQQGTSSQGAHATGRADHQRHPMGSHQSSKSLTTFIFCVDFAKTPLLCYIFFNNSGNLASDCWR